MRRGGAPRIFFLAAAALRRSKKTSKNGWGLIGGVGVNQAFCLDVTRPFERKRVLSKRVRGLYPPGADNYHDPPKFSIQSSLGSSKHRRMRCGRLPDPRPIPERVRGPICIQKK